MGARVPKGACLKQRVQTQPSDNTDGQAPGQMMRMPMLDTERNHIESDLGKEACEYQHADLQIIPARVSTLGMVQLRKQVQYCQTEQVCAGKGVEQLDVARVVKFEEENAGSAQNNRGEQKQVIHRFLSQLQTIC